MFYFVRAPGAVSLFNIFGAPVDGTSPVDVPETRIVRLSVGRVHTVPSFVRDFNAFLEKRPLDIVVSNGGSVKRACASKSKRRLEN